MLFSSIPFLFWFLPGVLILYAAAPGSLKNTGSPAFQPFFLWLGRTEVCDLDDACHPDGLYIWIADRALSECSEACQAFSRTFGFIQPSHAWLF